jgi:hypothetical protein
MKVAVTMVLIGALTGCSGGSPDAAPGSLPTSELAPVTSTPSPTPSPTPAGALTIAQARQVYLASVRTPNAAIRQLVKAYQAQPLNLADIRATAKRCDVANRQWAGILLNTPWPTEVVPSARDLAKAVAAETTAIRGFETVKTRAQFEEADAVYTAEIGKNVQDAVELLRSQLGLPPAT